ncbi:hypothetical protein Tco_1388201, partial [Tanacetum coccineum]
VLLDRFQSKLSSWKAILGSLGGLNIGSLKAFNLAILQKWRWRLLSHKNALLVKVIKALHGQEGGFVNNGLCRLEREKDCLIIDHINHGQWRWNWLRPNLGARNYADLLDMFFEISSAEINEVEDTCVWSLGTNGTFSVKDARCIIDSKILPSLAPSTVWDKNIPRKAISCPSCNGNVESSNHIFFECNIAKVVKLKSRRL